MPINIINIKIFRQQEYIWINSHEINMDYLKMYKCVYVSHILIQFLSFIQFVIHTNDAYQNVISLWSDQIKRKRFCESIKINIPYKLYSIEIYR